MIRVMTYNIRGGLGMDGQRSISRIADVVNAHSPDIVCFQEMHQRTPAVGLSRDQSRQLERLLRMPTVFQRNFNLGFGGEGIGIASRFPILSVRRHFLPSVRERRGLLEMQVQTPAGTLNVFCTHWGLNAQERFEQARATAQIIKQTSPLRVLCGDLNDHPTSLCLQELSFATDLYGGAHPDVPTFPSTAPHVKIDYVLCSPELRIESATVIDSQASDHCPLLTELETGHI
jgi:endonuclease/exonuclease/phosphatase family metal-dependent hydrolase